MENVKDLRKNEKVKLDEMLLKKQVELVDTRLKASTGIQKDTTVMLKLKKDIARIKTVLKEKEVLNEG